MQEIKYQPLKYNDDNEPVIQEHNLAQHSSSYYFLQACKRHWFIKVILICFIVVKMFYVINNFERVINWLQSDNKTFTKNYNRTGMIIENTTRLLYEDESVTRIYDIFENKNNILTSNKSQIKNFNNNAISNYTNATFLATYEITTDAVVATTYYLKNTTMHLYVDSETMGNNFEANDYDNASFIKTTTTTLHTIIDLKDGTNTTTINLNSNRNKKTIIEKLTTTKTLFQTIADLPPTSTLSTTTTTTKELMTTPLFKTPATSVNKTSSQKYFINTSQCHIPFVEPFTPEIRKMFKPKHSTGCTNDQPIITVTFNEHDGYYNLHINYTVAKSLRKHFKKNVTIEDDVLCCYQQIVRSGSGSNVDGRFKLLPCTNFHQDFTVPRHINFIIVKCKSKSKNKYLQEDAFSFIQVNKTLIQQEHQNGETEGRKPSILMIGIDSLSRINFRRNMPNMLKYLTDNKWYELMGYNKVGDNTLPNLMPVLAGYTKKTVKEKCSPNIVGGFDNCNFVWTKFKNNGFYTAYAEDTTFMSTFNYLMKGFKKPPTDYYFRPMALAIEKSLKGKKKDGLSYCLGRRQYGEYIYDFGMEFATRYKNLSSFGFFWTNSFSHNWYATSATMDNTMVNYFKEFEKRGILENSVVIFFSDHGVRWGPLLKLSEGFLEERLPLFFMSVPNWFRQKYPELVKNLETNQRRLTSPFDIHMTLQHLLKLGQPNYEIQQALDCPNCQSIFKEIPENRTCDDACIPKTWCTCKPYKQLSTKNELVKNITGLIVNEINNYYDLRNLTSLCSSLKLDKITNAKIRYNDETSSSNNIDTYAIDFETEPLTKPKTLFSATVDYDVARKTIHLKVEDISRQSLYENTANCTDDKQAKKYCICKNSLT